MTGVIGKRFADVHSVLNAGGFITCTYTCGVCDVVDQGVSVVARTGEDVLIWLRMAMTPALMRDHRGRSPECRATAFKNVMIPIPPGTEKIGGPVIN